MDVDIDMGLVLSSSTSLPSHHQSITTSAAAMTQPRGRGRPPGSGKRHGHHPHNNQYTIHRNSFSGSDESSKPATGRLVSSHKGGGNDHQVTVGKAKLDSATVGTSYSTQGTYNNQKSKRQPQPSKKSSITSSSSTSHTANQRTSNIQSSRVRHHNRQHAIAAISSPLPTSVAVKEEELADSGPIIPSLENILTIVNQASIKPFSSDESDALEYILNWGKVNEHRHIVYALIKQRNILLRK
jgi:hypothetical protein